MSNKTPIVPAVATESALKNRRDFFAKLLLGLILLLIGGFLLLLSGGPQDNSRVLNTPAGNKLKLEVANTEDLRRQGLSGRGSLDGGMLFVYDEPALDHCIWMHDMNFAIDIVWLDESKSVVDIKESVAPASYPENFCPREKTLYVIELGAKEAATNGIKVGDTLKF